MRVCMTPTPPLPLFAPSLHEHVRRSSRRSACLRLFVSRKRSTLTPTHGRTSNFTHPGRTRRTPSTSSLSSRSSASPSARSFSCVVSPRLSFPCGALVCSFANSQRSKKTSIQVDYEACVDRIKSDTTGEAHCTGQYFDYWSCVDTCVAPKLFGKLQ